MKKIAVIGAGITGVTTAYALQRRGFDVSVFERNRYAAMETSFANGGQLSASNAEVWTQWGTIFKGIKWLLDPGAPLRVNPLPNWHKYSWMAEFMSNIPNYQRNTTQTARLAIAAREHLKSHAAAEGFEFDLEERGILHIYENEADFRHATHVNSLLSEGGLERRPVTPDEMTDIEPSLHGDFYGGYYTTSDFTGDIHQYTMGLAQAVERHGGAFHYGVSVDDVSIEQQSDGTHQAHLFCTHEGAADQAMYAFDAVVVCAGVHSRALAAKLGDRANIYPVKGYSITVNLNDSQSQASAPWVSLLDDHAKVVTSRLGRDRFRIAGTAEFNGYNLDIRHDRIQPLVKWCERFFPGVSTEHAVPWAGLRPMMPNMMPKVEAGRRPGVFYNTGHGHLGWTLSAATAEIIADKVQANSK